MAIIYVDLPGLSADEQALNRKIQEMTELIQRTDQLLRRVSNVWIGQSGTAFLEMMTQRRQSAGNMLQVLREFQKYLNETQRVFMEADRAEAASIRNSF